MIKAKRFWKDVFVTDEGKILLDERVLKTPEKRELIAPTPALAEAIAQEWRDIEGEIDAASTPMTKMANSAIDRIPQSRSEVILMLAEYSEFELIAFREAQNTELMALQNEKWNPWVEWGRKQGFALPMIRGVVMNDENREGAGAQSREELLAISQEKLSGFSDFALVPVHEFITITGSFQLGLAIALGAISADQAFELSRLDENYQIAKWGKDDDAERLRESHLAAIMNAERFFQHLNLNDV